MGQDGIPISIAVIISSAIFGAVFLVAMVLMAVLSA